MENTNVVKTPWYKNWKIWAVIILIGIIGSAFNDKKTKPQPVNVLTTSTQSTTSEQITNQDKSSTKEQKQHAQEELDKIVNTAINGKILSSYRIYLDTEMDLYADTGWYSSKVDFKKQMLYGIGRLKKTITGKGHFIVKDAYSNEVLAKISEVNSQFDIDLIK